MLQTGSYYDRRASIDIDQPINENVATRLNAFYEKSNTFRDFGHLERYGVNPTITWKPDASTKIRLSYEPFHDERTAELPHVRRFVSARLGRSVQHADKRHRNLGAAKIREQGSRLQMEHISAPALQCGRVQSRSHQCAAARS